MPAPTAATSRHVLDWAEIVTRTGETPRLSAADLALRLSPRALPPGAVVVARPASRASPASRRRSRARMAEIRAAREAIAAGARPHRRFHVPQPAGHEGLGADRCGRLPRPDARRRAGVGEALQLPDQHRRAPPRPIWKGLAKRCGAACSPRRGVTLEWEIHRIGVRRRDRWGMLAGIRPPQAEEGA